MKKLVNIRILKIEIVRLMWNPAMVPLVIGSLGAVQKSFELHLRHLNIDKITIGKIQKATLLGLANIM